MVKGAGCQDFARVEGERLLCVSVCERDSCVCAREREKVVLVMAMLAERRSKQKWSEDPRNTRWSEGDSRD